MTLRRSNQPHDPERSIARFYQGNLTSVRTGLRPSAAAEVRIYVAIPSRRLATSAHFAVCGNEKHRISATSNLWKLCRRNAGGMGCRTSAHWEMLGAIRIARSACRVISHWALLGRNRAQSCAGDVQHPDGVLPLPRPTRPALPW